MGPTIVKANTTAAARLFLDGQVALAEIEQHGFRVNMKRLETDELLLEKKITKLIKEVSDTKEGRIWKKWVADPGLGKKPRDFNPLSNPQLADFLFKVLKLKPTAFTDKGNPTVDDDALALYDLPFCDLILELRKADKTLGTFLNGIRVEQINGWLRTFFNLNINISLRGQSDSPNFQNFPIRDREQGRIIRDKLYPRIDHQLMEVDFGALEVHISHCYHQDPTMDTYLRDESKDMHRDTSSELFFLDPLDTLFWANKEPGGGYWARFHGKNGFVFPEFYGSWFKQVAPNLWRAARELKSADGKTMYQHLKEHGICGLGEVAAKFVEKGTFLHHVQKVEKKFWYERFPIYTEWKEEWYRQYVKRGHFNLFTGFTCSGVMRRNEVLNYPVQGAAFHCLLWSMIQLHNWLKRYNMKTRIVSQIHDSILLDIHPSEVEDVVAAAHTIMTKTIRKHWDWIIIPLKVEFEIAPINGSWNEKQKLKVRL